LASGRLPAERRGTVVELICSRGGPDDLATVLAGTVAGNYEPDVQRRVLELLTDAAVTRKVRPSGDLSIIEKVVHAPTADRETRLAAVRLASVWKVTSIADELVTAALDGAADPALRVAALDGLAQFGDASSKAALVKLAGDGQAATVRLRAAAALARLDLAAAAHGAAGALPDVASIDEIAPLLDAFLTRKGGPDVLAAALRDKPLPADAAKLALRHMYSVGRSDAALSDVLGKAAGIGGDVKPPSPEELKQLVAEVAAKGDAARGEEVFRRADLSCLKCHTVSKAGGSVGPELSAVGSISPVDYLVNSIVDPNLAIKEQFVTRVIVTADGETFTGIVVDRDEVRVNLKDAAGKVVAIPTADIDEEAEGKSLMPQGLTKFLTHQELIDLVRFLSELGKPGPYAIRKTPTVQRWRLLKPTPAAIADDVPNAARLKQFALSAPAEAWVPVYGKVGGDLPLADLVRPGEAVYLQAQLDVVRQGEISFYTTPHEGVTVWLDGAPVAVGATISISDGRHTITVRVAREPTESHQSLRMEFRKSEGSRAQFEVVGGP
jgi:putative heme-binding domain-containing protein